MKKFTSILLLLFFVFSCTSNTIYKKPKDLIAESLMVDLIVDMQIANGARNIKTKEGTRMKEYMPLVYEKYGIDSARFARSNFYYSTKIDDYSKLLRKVQEKLEKIEKELNKQVDIQDSIKNANRKKANSKKNQKLKNLKLKKYPTTIDSVLK